MMSSDPAQVERVLLCSGKVYYDLAAQRETADRGDTALIRVELLYPFPDGAIARVPGEVSPRA